jgi:hypothetical protein
MNLGINREVHMWNKLKTWIVGAAANLVYEYVFEFVVDIVLDRLMKYKEEIDWAKVQTDINKKIKAAVPTVILEEICIAIASVVLGHFRGLLRDVATCEKVRKALAEGDLKEAKRLAIQHFRTWVL